MPRTRLGPRTVLGLAYACDAASNGTGLQGIADRLAALGGGIDVRSDPGRGTTITGSLPT